VSYLGLKTNVVYHAVGTYDSNTLRLYVDGALVASRAIGALPLNTSNRRVLTGEVDTSGGVWIDDLALYGRALAAAQVAAHYQAGSG
jgi:hypothetical protein